MAITYALLKDVTSQMYARSLRQVPSEATAALRAARSREEVPVARRTLDLMLDSAEQARERDHLLCSDSGIPTYSFKIGTRAVLPGDVKAAVRDGFLELAATSDPPLLKHVTNPLTNERGFAGKDMPIMSFDLIDGADHVEIVCSPKALGTGRWSQAEILVSPSLQDIEEWVLDAVVRAGSQACPPMVVGVGIGGTFEHAAHIAKEAVLRPMREESPEPTVRAMEERLREAINATGFGPMGTGGATTAMAVHVNYSSGHGYTPAVVCFNCWIDRRYSARIDNDGTVTHGV
ncbi:fumarate hydratase [Nocardioides hwasunensis]|uniref:Fumarate hydratase n=1 Tax=Nocardioides hwasunensis TaxID=397258 RepID=A0ABR8MJ37_9ACTN|nr:fumarate hydratase [Nocardioides hwasunensis]MBD3915595.1 fumarate hydratase [Nocardioides hwasunensis]